MISHIFLVIARLKFKPYDILSILTGSGRKMVSLYSTFPEYLTASKLLRIAIW